MMRKAAGLLFAGNLISKILGFGREIIVAALFGTGQTIGAFRVAQAGTAVPINFLTSDSLNSAFIPLYKQYQNEQPGKAQSLFFVLLALFSLLSLLLTAGLWLAADLWVKLLAPGLDPGTSSLASSMIQIMGLGIPFYIFSALFNFLSVAHNDFSPMAARPIIQNIGLIGGALAAYATSNPLMFAWSFSISFAAFSIWNVWRASTSKLIAWPNTFNWPDNCVLLKAFWRTLRPLLLLPFFLQGNIVVERMVASLIGLAAISSLDYARFVTETMILLISVPIAFAGLSHWSGLKAEAIHKHLMKTLTVMLIVAIPASLFLSIHSTLVVQVLYARGAFNSESVKITSDILLGTSIGLWAQVIGYVLIKGLNAQMRNRAVLWVMIAALLANVAFNLILHPYLGAMTLGLGNTAYSLALLAGTLSALKLWREFFVRSRMVALGGLGYLILSSHLPSITNIWASLTIAGCFAILYWAIWIMLVPSLRQVTLGIIMRKSGEKN